MGGYGSGRRRKPVDFHKARKTFRRDRHPDEDVQPRRDNLDLRPPAFLSGAAKQEWEAKAEMLHRLGLLTELDLDAFALLCVAQAEWRQAVRMLDKHGAVVKGKRSPWVGLAKAAHEQVLRLEVEFGLTPSSRRRVTVSKQKGTTQQRDRFFGGTAASVTPTAALDLARRRSPPADTPDSAPPTSEDT